MNAQAIDTEQARFNMIEQQIRPWEVLDATVLHTLTQVHREDFVPAVHRALAFTDMEIPLPCGQCMLAPRVEARLLQELQVQPTDKVLEIGTGSGHMAALLGAQAERVISLEIESELVRMARDNLQRAGLRNVEVREADGSQGAPSDAPFDVILLSGSVAQIPDALLQQLAPGGRLAAIVGDEPMMRATVVRRVGPQSLQTTQPWDTVAPRLRNFPQPSRFRF